MNIWNKEPLRISDNTLCGVRKWLASPMARKGGANDWVLVLKTAEE